MKKNIMFLCTGNSCRSQMAEGFAHKFWDHKYNIYSAGTKKHGMNPFALKVMSEKEIDLSSQYSKTLDELPSVKFDYVVTVCDNAHETCPYFEGGRIIHIGFQDPPLLAKGIEEETEVLKIYRSVRDEIEDFIINMEDRLGLTD